LVNDKLSLGTNKAWSTKWTFGKFKDPDGEVARLSKSGMSIDEIKELMPDRFLEKSIVDGNLALNEGIAELLLLLTGGTATAFDNTNAYIGVGSDATAESASQTGLIGVLAYVVMDATFPTISAQTVTFKATFAAGIGTGSWQEFTVANGSSDAADNLNRKVSDKGTKAAGESWIAQVDITVS